MDQHVHYRARSRGCRLSRGPRGTVIHIEPRQSLTAANAGEWVRNAPGTEGLLALAVLRVLVDQGMADRAYAGPVAQIDVKKVAEESGVDAKTIEHVAEAFGRGKPSLAIASGRR